MNHPPDPLDTLLLKLTGGDDSAAERVFRDYEPFLRAIVRKRLTPALRSKFDSVDVVQGVWADVLEGYREEGWNFSDREHLRAFLARVAYNHFCNACREHRVAIDRERPMPDDESLATPVSALPRASQVVQADELWETIQDLCPPDHLDVVRLKRQGLTPGEIATRTGLHEGSVRRILYDLAKRLAERRQRVAR